MQNKTKNWNDVEMFISAVAIALTLGMWSMFAGPKKNGTDGAQADASLTMQPQTSESNPAATMAPASMLLPGQILLFGNALPTVSAQPAAAPGTTVTTTTTTTRTARGGKSGGTVTKTRSSHP